MDVHGRVPNSATAQSEEEMELRRGPWTVEEDLILMNYIANHGEGRWNSLARCADNPIPATGLKRTGKSCRLRWLNYLRPDVRRGNITPEEQLLILELHSRWGNRWSKIAQHLPGRTDNEIKNYWRTRVQKHARQLQCDVNSKKFRDAMRYLWMPRLIERIRAAQAQQPACPPGQQLVPESFNAAVSTSADSVSTGLSSPPASEGGFTNDSFSAVSAVAGQGGEVKAQGGGGHVEDGGWPPESLPSPGGYVHQGWPDFETQGGWGGDMGEHWWNVSDIWSMQQ